MSSASRHFRLESQRRQGLVLIAAFVLVGGACITSLTRYQGVQRGLPTAALAVDGDFSSSDSAWPQLYNVTYYLSAANFLGNTSQANTSYTAQSSMQLGILQATSSVTFHSQNLQYTSVTYSVVETEQQHCICGQGQGCPSTVCSSMLQPTGSTTSAGDVVTVQFRSMLFPGQSVIIYTEYTGSLLSGLARTAAFDYTNPGTRRPDTQVWITASLEPSRARQMLPCFDLPHIKANFSISLQVPDGMTARSTAAEQKSQPGSEPGTTLHTFGTTPKMSTYLIGVTVGQMVSSSAPSNSGKSISVWSVLDLAEQHAVALQAAVEGTNFYEGYTGVALPLQKLDFMAVPGRGGAVENWGLMQFDERRLLVNEASEGAYGRWLAADVVCHELGHQWFGDYVTCSDWDNIAVNEALASFLEYKCISAAFPEMSGAALFARAIAPLGENIGNHEGPRETALQVDASPYIEPLLSNMTVGFLDYYPKIPYSKGAAMWHMLEAYFNSAGQDVFQEGMRILMSRHALSTASLDDVLIALLDGFEALSGSTEAMQQLKQSSKLFSASRTEALALLHSWIDQPGFPLVNMSADGSASQQGRFYDWGSQTLNDPFSPVVTSSNISVTNSSDSLTSSNTSTTNSSNSSTWYIPMEVGRVAAAGNAESEWAELSLEAGSAVELSLAGNPSANLGGAGYFRTQYPPAHQQQLISNLATLTSEGNATLPVLLRANAFISDVFALGLAGNIDPSNMLRAAAAVAASPAAAEGFGMHLLVLPAIEALQQLSFYTYALEAGNACGIDLRNVTRQLMGSFADPIIAHELTVDDDADLTKYKAETYDATQADFLYDHSEAKVLGAAAMAGYNPAVQFVCSPYTHSLSTRDITRDPDLRGVVYQLAVAQPEGCKPAAGLEETWKAMLYKWRSNADIQEAERGLYALPWAPTADLLRQTLNITFAGEEVTSRSPNNNAGAVLRNIGSNPSGDGLHGSSVAWAWVQDNFAGSLAAQVLPALEFLPLLPTQQNLDSLQAFLDPLPNSPIAVQASKERLVAKLQHQLQWLTEHLQAGSELCQVASQLASSAAAT